MMSKSRHAFTLLSDAVARLEGAEGRASPMLDAMFVWATVHGLASALQGSVVSTLGLDARTRDAIPGHVLERIGTGLDGRGRQVTGNKPRRPRTPPRPRK
jgi:hypothetical protein